MKKVISVLFVIVVLILGTAVGVAVSASRLDEKTLLDAGDVWVALASQGLLGRPAAGLPDSLTVDGVKPVVFKTNGVYLAVYEFEDALMIRQPDQPIYTKLNGVKTMISPVGIWRNLMVCSITPIQSEHRDPQHMTAKEQARWLAADERINEKGREQVEILFYRLNKVQTRIVQVETAQMIYTFRQMAYSMPTKSGRHIEYDNWLSCQLQSCQYKQLPEDKPLRTVISLSCQGKTLQQWSERNDVIWDGQAPLQQIGLSCGGKTLTEQPAVITYHLRLTHGELLDETEMTIDLGGWT